MSHGSVRRPVEVVRRRDVAVLRAVGVLAFADLPHVLGGAVEVLVVIIDDGRRAWLTGQSAACRRRMVEGFAILARGAPVPVHQGPVVAALVRLPARAADGRALGHSVPRAAVVVLVLVLIAFALLG